MSELENSLTVALIKRRLLKKGDRVVVAVSGGVDSMVLLHLLHRQSHANRWTICVAHFNHRLRGRSSDADQRLVQRAAIRFGLRFETAAADIRELARNKGISIEMAARDARHRFLAVCAKKFRAKKIALAHHADDQVETFFIRLFRGAGTDALSGMKWVNASPAMPALQLIRPLLDQPKQRLVEYAVAHKVEFREDASNFSDDIQRNRIRRELLPLLQSRYQPGVRASIRRIQEIVEAEGGFVSAAAESWLKQQSSNSSATFEDLHLAVQRRVIQIQLDRLQIPGDFDLIEKLRMSPDVACSSRSAENRTVRVCVIRLKSGRLELRTPFEAQFDDDILILDTCKTWDSIDFAGLRVRYRVVAKSGRAFPKTHSQQEWFDAEQVGARITLRHWRKGDRFQPIGSPKTLKLQDFFVNLKIPRERRHKLVLACTMNGDIFWVEGLRISERFKLTDQTNRRLQWRWKRL